MSIDMQQHIARSEMRRLLLYTVNEEFIDLLFYTIFLKKVWVVR